MSTVTKAIILGAGQGKRLLPLTAARPKCLLEFSGRTLLSWQLSRLRIAGVTEAVVVTGFEAETVEAEVAKLDLGPLKVRTLFNPFYAVADNLVSCWVARSEFAGGTLLLNGDTLFETDIARSLIGAPAADITVTIDRKPTYDHDDMKVLTDGGELKAIGKTIDRYDAESIGFLRFNTAGAERFVAAVERTLRDPEGLRFWYLSVIDRIARNDGGVHVQSIEGLSWAETDFPQDIVTTTALTEQWLAAGA